MASQNCCWNASGEDTPHSTSDRQFVGQWSTERRLQQYPARTHRVLLAAVPSSWECPSVRAFSGRHRGHVHPSEVPAGVREISIRLKNVPRMQVHRSAVGSDYRRAHRDMA